MIQKRRKNHDVRILILLLSCAGIIVLGCLILNGFTWMRMHQSSDEQNEAFDRLAQYSTVLSCLQDIKLGERGYLITGDQEHLDVFFSAREQFESEWERLEMLEVEAGNTGASIKKLDEASLRLISDASEIVKLVQELGHRNLQSELFEKRSDSAMAQVRQLYNSKLSVLEETIRERGYRAEGDFQAGLATSLSMGFLALGLGVIAFSLLRRVLKETERSERYSISMLKAEESRRQKDIFLAMMSHEIRTPLNAIIGFGQMAEREEMGPKGQRYVKSILDGGKSLLLLINDILDLSKLQAGRMELKQEPAQLSELVGFLNRLFKENCHRKGIKFHVNIQEGLPGFVIIDSVRLRQVLMNLVGNAVTFTEEGRVVVSVNGSRETESGNKWNLAIAVTDTGKGISDEDLKHLFEPFYRSKDGNDTKAKGTGLGLSIVHSFLKLMGGDLSVKSKIGEGTTFTVELRDVEASDQKVIPIQREERQINLNDLPPVRILAVDDNETNRELIGEIFAGSHHQVAMAADGDEAVRKVNEEIFNIILMDLRMPVKDGTTAAKEIKANENFRNIPIIAVSAGSLPTAIEGDTDFGEFFDAFLEKPFTREQLYEILSKFLEAPKSEGEKETTLGGDQEHQISLELLSDLDALLTNHWFDVKSEMVVSNVEAFSKRLEAIIAGSQSQKLAGYAAKLKKATDDYSFSDMEAELERFPDLVSELKAIHDSSDA